MRFEALELSLDTIRNGLRPIVPTIRRRDPKLATHIRDAANSVSLNLGEGSRRQGADRIQHWNIASGSAEEVRTALRVADAWAYIAETRTTTAQSQIDHLQAILWKLTH